MMKKIKIGSQKTRMFATIHIAEEDGVAETEITVETTTISTTGIPPATGAFTAAATATTTTATTTTTTATTTATEDDSIDDQSPTIKTPAVARYRVSFTEFLEIGSASSTECGTHFFAEECYRVFTEF